jgi:hypothetical protein
MNEMNINLQNAIKEYCIMLPYLNQSSNPNDDTRLVKIAYEYVLSDIEQLDFNFFKNNMSLNMNFQNIDEDVIEKFISNRIDLIMEYTYVINILRNLSLLKD